MAVKAVVAADRGECTVATVIMICRHNVTAPREAPTRKALLTAEASARCRVSALSERFCHPIAKDREVEEIVTSRAWSVS